MATITIETGDPEKRDGIVYRSGLKDLEPGQPHEIKAGTTADGEPLIIRVTVRPCPTSSGAQNGIGVPIFTAGDDKPVYSPQIAREAQSIADY